MHKSILAGLGAGLAAAALWAAIAWGSGYSFSFLAAFMGLAVGIAFRMADKERASTARGIAAAALTIVVILVGKFAVASIAAAQTVDEAIADYELDMAHGDDLILAEISDQIIDRREEAGIESDWPDNDEDSDAPADYYPADVWAQAQHEFYALSEAEQQAVRDEYGLASESDARESASALTILYFIFGFRLLDLLWIGTSIGAAYKFGTVTETPDENAPTPIPDFSTGSPLRGMPTAEAPGQHRDAA